MAHISVDRRSSDCDRCVPLVGFLMVCRGMDLQDLCGYIGSQGSNRNERLDWVSSRCRVRDPPSLMVWASEKSGANGTAMDPMTSSYYWTSDTVQY